MRSWMSSLSCGGVVGLVPTGAELMGMASGDEL
jgi:hypothetical protein